MKNVHVLPTEKPSQLVKGKHLYFYKDGIEKEFLDIDEKFQHIYIISDEKTSPKKGDWYLGHPNYISIHRWHTDVSKIDGRNVFLNKIILTTDQDLIEEGVQPIDDDFLEWFVKNPSCEFVEVEEFGVKIDLLEYETKYKIIIPQEEPKKEFPTVNGSYGCTIPIKEPKQETLEEAAENYGNKKGDIPTTELEDAIFKQGFIDGAKWQSERMYSEEELKNAIEVSVAKALGVMSFTINEESFEEFKKKN